MPESVQIVPQSTPTGVRGVARLPGLVAGETAGLLANLRCSWQVLWALTVGLVAYLVVYAVLWTLVLAGMLGSDALTAWEGNVRFVDQDVGGDHGWPVLIPAWLAGFITVGGALIIVRRLRKLF